MNVLQLRHHSAAALTLLSLGVGLAYGAFASLRPFAGSDAPTADLSLAWSRATPTVSAGEAFAYALTVTNAGPGTATSVMVTVALPTGLTGVTGWGSGWACSDVADGVLTCSRSELPVGAAPDIALTGIPAGGGRLRSTASVSSTTRDPVEGNNTAVDETVLAPAAASADLSIAMWSSPVPVKAGFPLTCRVIVTNAGPDPASGVTVTHTLPVGVTTASGSGEGWTCNPPVAGVVTCTAAGLLPLGEAPALSILMSAPLFGPVTSTASVTSETADPDTANNSVTTSITITLVADISVAVDASPDPVPPGGTLTYTITVTNHGPSPVTNAFGELLYSSSILTNVVASADNSWEFCGSGGANNVLCGGRPLGAGESATMRVTATAPAQGEAIASVLCGPTPTDPDTSNNTLPVRTPVATKADLSISTTDSPDPVLPGGFLTYTLAVTNHGPSTAMNATVTDTFPAGLTAVSARGTGWSCGTPEAGAVTCTRQFFATGDSVIKVTGLAPGGGVLTNTATVVSSTTDPDPANGSDTETTTIPDAGQLADLSITGSEDEDTIGAGMPITWILQVANGGPAAAGHVVVTDSLPPGTTHARASGSGWTFRSNGTTIECTRSSLAVGPAPAITITAQAPETTGNITNLAEVVSDKLDAFLDDNVADMNTVLTSTHDLAVVKIQAPAKVTLGGGVSSTTARVKVQIQNRSPHDETIVDASRLASLVHLTAESLGEECPDIQGTLVTGLAQAPLPRTLHAKQKLSILFDVALSSACVHDPAKSSARDPGHEDYRFVATVDHAALEGEADTHPEDDVCPRVVAPPFVVDPYPDGSIKDKGCGKQKRDGTLGDPITTDLWVRD